MTIPAASQKQKGVFISYRRKDEGWALWFYDNLQQHHYDVFIDVKDLRSGQFEPIIVEAIKARAHFLVLLTPDALDRCKDPGDVLRREMETALDTERHIVPVLLSGFNFSSPKVGENLPGKLELLRKHIGLDVPPGYAHEARERLRANSLM